MTETQFNLFECEQSIKGMVHSDDPSTSVVAANSINQCKSRLHQKVMDAFGIYGSMTDSELEGLDEFKDYGPSTIRKRRSELYQSGKLEVCGERNNNRGFKMLVWKVK